MTDSKSKTPSRNAYYTAFDKIRENEFQEILKETEEKLKFSKELGSDEPDIKETLEKVSRKFYDITLEDLRLGIPEYSAKVKDMLKEDHKIMCGFYKKRMYSNILQQAIVMNLLTQDMMAPVYLRNRIQPNDVAEFIKKQTASPDKMMDIIDAHSRIYEIAAGSDKILAPAGRQNKEHLDYINYISSNDYLGKEMLKFSMQKERERIIPKEDKKWYKDPIGWLKQKKHSFTINTTVVVLAAGISAPVAGLILNSLNSYTPEPLKDAKLRLIEKVKPSKLTDSKINANKTSMKIVELVKDSKINTNN